jgi:hypothetical protein
MIFNRSGHLRHDRFRRADLGTNAATRALGAIDDDFVTFQHNGRTTQLLDADQATAGETTTGLTAGGRLIIAELHFAQIIFPEAQRKERKIDSGRPADPRGFND